MKVDENNTFKDRQAQRKGTEREVDSIKYEMGDVFARTKGTLK
jgi:hypothetical protein